MPMYEYRCRTCGSKFEELVKLRTKDEEVECPECGAYQSERLVSAFAVKGGGSASGGGGCGPTGSS